MRNLSDHDIDQLFRQAAEQNQPEFDPADWKIVAHQLDRSGWWLRLGKWFGGTAGVAVIATSGWFAVNYFALTSQEKSQLSGSITEKVESETVESSDAVPTSDSSASDRMAGSNMLAVVDEKGDDDASRASAKPDHTSESHTTGSARAEGEKTEEGTVAEERSEIISDAKVGNMPQGKIRNAKSNALNQKLEDVDSGMTGGKISAAAPTGNASHRSEGTINSKVESTILNGSGTVAVQESAVSVERSVALEEQAISEAKKTKGKGHSGISQGTDDPEVEEDSVALKKEMISDKKVDREEEESDSTKEQPSFARFGLKLKVSPDYSSENFEASGKTGFNYGLEVEYFATEHLSISAGLIRSRKYYAMHDAQYFNFVDLDIDGDCQMWDIPLNVNYYFSPGKNYSLFVSGGFSSYLMSEENYTFQVTTPGYSGDETQVYARQVRGENQEWFKTLNISLGLQRRITRNFALQVEPFVKIPLAEVGSANIALSSFGTYLSLRYNFLFNQK